MRHPSKSDPARPDGLAEPPLDPAPSGWQAWCLCALLAVAYGAGLFVPLMDHDSARHANIALHMHLSGDFVQLVDEGKDYLDKPHLHFWLAALSYRAFGVGPFAYKLPSLLFSLLAIYSSYRLGRRLHSESAGRLAAVVLATSYAFVLANTDVRTDAILTGCVIFATWQLVEFVDRGRTASLVLACVGMALGFSTKGAVGVVMPALSAAAHLVQRRRWSRLADWRWLLAPVVVALFASPVLYCYYRQFDLHPEKVIRGESGVSGVWFILFGQSVDRYRHRGTVGDPLFVLHTMAWAVLPWTLLVFGGYAAGVRTLVRERLRARGADFAAVATLTVIGLIISNSKFKLPHYVNILLPWSAVLAASLLVRLAGRRVPVLEAAQLGLAGVLLAAAAALNLWVFPGPVTTAAVLVAVVAASALAWRSSATRMRAVVAASAFAAAGVGLLLNLNYYPNLVAHQAGATLAHRVREAGIPPESIFFVRGAEWSATFDFERAVNGAALSVDELKRRKAPTWVYAGPEGLKMLEAGGVGYETLFSADHFHVSKPRLRFLDPRTRRSSMTRQVVVAIQPAG